MSSTLPSSPITVSEQQKLSAKWDKCFENGVLKSSYGLLTGAAISLLFFRHPVSRAAVTFFSGGLGAGLSISDCQSIVSGKNTANLCTFKIPQSISDKFPSKTN